MLHLLVERQVAGPPDLDCTNASQSSQTEQLILFIGGANALFGSEPVLSGRRRFIVSLRGHAGEVRADSALQHFTQRHATAHVGM